MEFLTVDSIESAREKLISYAGGWLCAKKILPLEKALGKILAEDIFAKGDIPAFRRSSVDGYAVLAENTAAAGESIPVFLNLVGQVEMGKAAGFSISSGECAEVPTGGMLPDGATAVVMVEYSEAFGSGIALYKSAAYGENVVQAGEDAKCGTLLLKRGKLILPQDIGALAAAGINNVPVFAPPRLTIISTGDELVHPSLNPMPGQVRDINTYALMALAEKIGFEAVSSAIAPDEPEALENAVRGAMDISDIVVVSGGSSKGKKDMTKDVLDKLSAPGVFTHGLAVKPGKPTILGFDENSKTILAGLPGHPVSAMIIFELIFNWLFREITGAAGQMKIPARLSSNVASSPGKLTCQPCSLLLNGSGYIAEPTFGKSGLITTLTKADGFFMIGRGTEGITEG
ncbi:MAG: molybdopterin molybdenumtransferase MoeA, partial [Clostridiales bacterium]|nr:molybdopterin molybdenumtransferase MoeA [Clostridiales bacterium]